MVCCQITGRWAVANENWRNLDKRKVIILRYNEFGKYGNREEGFLEAIRAYRNRGCRSNNMAVLHAPRRNRQAKTVAALKPHVND
jgi:hypothetical protein